MPVQSASRLVSALIVLAVSVPALASDSWESLGVSAQSLARGGADVAVGDSALSQVPNPATLALSPRHGRLFDVSGQFLFPSITWSTPIDSSTYEDLFFAPNVAITQPVNDRLTLGAAFYSKAGAFTEYRIRPLLMPQERMHFQGDYKNGAILFNAAYKLTDKLAAGAGVRFDAVTGKFSAPFGPANVVFDRVWALGGGLQFGLHYQATRKLALGAGYFTPSWMTNVKDGDFDIRIANRLPVSLGEANLSNWNLPQKLMAGAAYDLTSWWKLVGEARWINFRNSQCHDATIETHGTVLDLDIPFNLKFSDQWVFIAGSEFKLSPRWTLGVGYNYGSNPLPRTRVFPLAPPSVKHHLTAGLRYERDRWWVGGGYIYGFEVSESGPGYSAIPFGTDFGVSHFRHHQQEVFFGFGFRW